MSYVERPYRQLYPPEPVCKRHIVSTKDDVYLDEAAGTEVRVPIEERPTRKIARTSTFGTEIVEEPIP